MKKGPKYLIWNEPAVVRHRYYPAVARWGSTLSCRILGGLILFAAVMVCFRPHPDPTAMILVLSLCVITGASLAFGVPAILHRQSSTVGIYEGGIKRSDPGAMFSNIVSLLAAQIKGTGNWYWLNITKISLHVEDFDGETIRVLRVHGKEDKVLGWVGLVDKISNDEVAAWAVYKNRPFEVGSEWLC